MLNPDKVFSPELVKLLGGIKTDDISGDGNYFYLAINLLNKSIKSVDPSIREVLEYF